MEQLSNAISHHPCHTAKLEGSGQSHGQIAQTDAALNGLQDDEDIYRRHRGDSWEACDEYLLVSHEEEGAILSVTLLPKGLVVSQPVLGKPKEPHLFCIGAITQHLYLIFKTTAIQTPIVEELLAINYVAKLCQEIGDCGDDNKERKPATKQREKTRNRDETYDVRYCLKEEYCRVFRPVFFLLCCF